MKNSSASLPSALLAAAAAGFVAPGSTHAQDIDLLDRSGWFVRANAVARFNVKATYTGVRPTLASGSYDNGFVLPDAGGTASGKTWNWGYNSDSQISGGQLQVSRLDSVPTVGAHDANVSNPLLGGEIVGGYQFHSFQVFKTTARFGFELAYGYSSFSEGMNYGASGTSTLTTDSFGLGGILPPVAPYAGTATGPGPLIDLNAASHTPITSGATAAFQGHLDTTLHSFRLGPSFELDLSKRVSLALSAGYSSIYADNRLRYTEGVTFANGDIPNLGSSAELAKGNWRPGIYAELRANYRISDKLDAFLGADFQHNNKMTFGDVQHRVELDLSMTYGAKGGVVYHF